MLIHRYMPADKCLMFLIDLKLEASLPSQQNDPFELAIRIKSHPRSILEEEARRIAGPIGHKHSDKQMIDSITDKFTNGYLAEALSHGIKKIADTQMRFISFSAADCDEQSQILMWSHYARSHQGFRIELDTSCFRSDADNPLFRKIGYTNERVELDWLNIDNESTMPILTTKFKAWEYEKEIRLIASPDNCPNGLLDIPRQSIKAIYAGVACNTENISRAKKLVASLSNNQEIKFFTSKTHDRDFKIIYTEEPL